jgi:hypothetical protein
VRRRVGGAQVAVDARSVSIGGPVVGTVPALALCSCHPQNKYRPSISSARLLHVSRRGVLYGGVLSRQGASLLTSKITEPNIRKRDIGETTNRFWFYVCQGVTL